MKASEDMLFALLRASIHEKETETSYFKNVSDKHCKPPKKCIL